LPKQGTVDQRIKESTQIKQYSYSNSLSKRLERLSLICPSKIKNVSQISQVDNKNDVSISDLKVEINNNDHSIDLSLAPNTHRKLVY